MVKHNLKINGDNNLRTDEVIDCALYFLILFLGHNFLLRSEVQLSSMILSFKKMSNIILFQNTDIILYCYYIYSCFGHDAHRHSTISFSFSNTFRFLRENIF
jgi:hypothetical protein